MKMQGLHLVQSTENPSHKLTLLVITGAVISIFSPSDLVLRVITGVVISIFSFIVFKQVLSQDIERL
uniref:Uncharacterized protein n=1 Tax=Rhizophora mucronata TaxID=61149 RepID=A0A2P2L1N6_RHIMU